MVSVHKSLFLLQGARRHIVFLEMGVPLLLRYRNTGTCVTRGRRSGRIFTHYVRLDLLRLLCYDLGVLLMGPPSEVVR